MSLTKWLAGVLLGVATLAAACGPGRATTLPGTVGPATQEGTSGHRGCLDPRQPGVAPPSGWLPDTQGPAYDIGTGALRGAPATPATAPPVIETTIPTNDTSAPAPAFSPPTTQVPPSQPAAALAARFQAAAGHGFFANSTITEFVAGGCVIERDMRLDRADKGYAYLQVLQLRRPFSPYSFPLGRDYQRQRLTGGSELLLADFDHDASRLTAVVVRPDGLLVRVVVASPDSTDVTGWPTTFASPLPRQAHTPAALTMPEVAALAQNLIGSLV